MAITGTIPLSKMQVALESTPGTAIAATRIMPILSGSMNQHMDNIKHAEQRASLIRHYRAPIQTKRYVEISGMEVAPTYEDIVWYLQCALIGHATPGTALSPTTSNTSVKTYTYTPSASQGVTQSATLEVGNDTQAWKVTHAVINRLEFGWSVGGGATLTVDWLGAKAVTGSYTSALSVVSGEDIVGAVAKAYIDTSTIGSTLVTTMQDFKFSIDNHLTQYWAPNGDIIPVQYYHSEARTMHVETTVAYTANTEYAAFLAKTQRKIRTKIEGTEIASSSPSTNKSITVDWYGYWDEAPWSDQDGLVVQRFVGDSVYDSTATWDWSVAVANALTSIT